MAPGLIVPGVCRYAVKGDYAGVPVVNILDMHIDSIGSGRAANVLDQAKVIVSAWADEILPVLSNMYHCDEVSWVDMDTSSGSTGSTADGTGTNFPQNGASAAVDFPGSISLLVKKNIVAARGSRQGRMFLVGALEAWTSHDFPNTFESTATDPINVRLGDFLSAINQSAGITGVYDSDLVVVHTKMVGPPGAQVLTYTGRSHVDSLTCDAKVHTQRRRLGR